MKKISVYLFLILCTVSAFAQTTEVTVGSSLICGTSITKRAPAQYDYVLGKNNTWTKMLYKASSINTSGKIKSIAFFIDCTVTSDCTFNEAQNQKIYVKEVDETQFSSASEPDLSTFKKVYDGNITWRRGKMDVEKSKTIIVFNEAFEYSGKKSLVIYFLNENNKPLGDYTGCGSSPSFLWSYSGEKTVAHEQFKKGGKTGYGKYDKVLPIIRLYFNNAETKDVVPSPETTQITATPTEIKADGESSSFIKVQLYNAGGSILKKGGATVTLSTTAGQLGKVTDNGDGTYTAHLKSSNNKETAVITGKINDKKITDTAEVKFTKNSSEGGGSGSSTGGGKSEGGTETPTTSNELVQGFSPNGDGKNDVWRILPNVLTKYPNNSMQVFNRYGNLVYQASPYKNDWNGISNGEIVISNNSKLPVGSYYFIFNTGKNNKIYQGWLYINY